MMKKILAGLLLLSFLNPLVAQAKEYDQAVLYGYDGSTLRAVQVDSTGKLKVSGASGGGSLTFATDAATTGHVTYVGCSDSIATAISAATAGDTLQLGSCTYTISSALVIDKSLRIVGQGIGNTILSDTQTAANNSFTITSDNVTLQGFKLSALSRTSGGNFIFVDATATTVFNNVNMFDLWLNAINTDTSGPMIGISYRDSGGSIENVVVHLEPGTEASQSKGIEHTHNSSGNTGEADTTLYMRNVRSEIYELDTAATGQLRPFFSWMNGTYAPAVGSVINHLQNVVLLVKPASTTPDTEGLQNQGNNSAYSAGVNGRVISYVYGGYIDGSYDYSTVGTSINFENYRVDDYATVYFYGTTFGQNGRFTSINNGQVYKIGGTAYLQGIQGDAPTQAPSSINANTLISLTGQQGGDKAGTGSQSGLVGADVSITGGAGGAATAATTTATAGAGGGWVYTSGAGGAETIVTSTTNIGGAGGDIQWYGGDGGVANGAGTTNTGGAAADIYLAGGLGGVGTTTTGADGDIYLAFKKGSTARGKVGIGQGTAATTLDIEGSISFSTATLTTVTSDDFPITAGTRSFWKIQSNASTCSSRDLLLSNPVDTPGALLILENNVSSSNCLEILDDVAASTSGNVRLTNDWIPATKSVLVLVSNGTDWVEISRNGTDLTSAQTISAGTTIVANDSCTNGIKQITSAGAVTTNTTNTFTAPAAGNTGCRMTVVNVGANNITLDNNALFKSAGGADVVMTPDDVVEVFSTGSVWYQATALEAN